MIYNSQWEKSNKTWTYTICFIILLSLLATLFFYYLGYIFSLPKFIRVVFFPILIFVPMMIWWKYDFYKKVPYSFSFKKRGLYIHQKFLRENKIFLKYSEIDSTIPRYETKKYFDEVVIKLKDPNKKKYGNFKKRGYGIIFQRIDKKIVNKLKENVKIIEE